MTTIHEFRVSYESPDAEWDDFLIHVDGGDHIQSSLWAQVNASIGWQTVRVAALRNKSIVAGAQVLFKPLSSSAAVGYIPRGPVFGEDHPALTKGIFTELSSIAQANHILLLALQPPKNVTSWLKELPKFNFQPSVVNMGPTATIIIDLSSDLENIFSHMKARTRQNIRLASRKGIRVLEGTARDLDKYYDLLLATSQRQQFSIYPKEFFMRMWEIFEPHGYIKMFLAEYKGDIVSAQLIVPFGNTVVNKMSVWSGKHSNLKPNEALQWYAINWSKKHGYRHFDLEGIDPQAAHAILDNRPNANIPISSYTLFKLGFSKNIVLLPGVFDYVYDKSMRLVYDKALSMLTALPVKGPFKLLL